MDPVPVTRQQSLQLFGSTCRVKLQRCDVPTPTAAATAEGPNSTAVGKVMQVVDLTGDPFSSDDNEDTLTEIIPRSAPPPPPPKNKKLGKGVPNRKSTSCRCTICRKTFSSKKTLKVHMRKHSGEKRYCCETCGRAFWSQSHYASHKKTSDEKNGICPVERKRVTGGTRGPEGLWTCKICGKRFKCRSSYSSHLISHRNEKPFKCEDCGKGFKERSALTQHGRIHSGVWQFSCVFCGKGFTQKSNYWFHLRGHTKEKPYFCVVEDCRASFRFEDSLKKHRRLRHLKKY